MLTINIFFLTLFLYLVRSQVPPTIVNSTLTDDIFITALDWVYEASVCARGSGVSPANKPTFQWKKYDEDLTAISSSDDGVTVCSSYQKHLTEADNGLYYCIVSNNFGKALTSATMVMLQIIPKIEVKIPIKKSANEYLELKCTNAIITPPLNSTNIDWRFNDKIIEYKNSDGSNIITNEGNLHFSSLVPANSGKYICIWKNPNRPDTRIGMTEYTLVVTAKPPENLDFSISLNYSEPSVGLVGESVELVCFFKGATYQSVTWKDPRGHDIAGNKLFDIVVNKLVIPKLEKSLAGTYTCEGTASLSNKKAVASVNLKVEERPKVIDPLDKPFNQNVTVGADAIFRCNPTADPKPEIEWLVNGKKWQEKPRYSLEFDRTQFKIENVQKVVDVFVVQCNVSNKHGRILLNGYLNVLSATKIIKEPKDVVYDPNSNATFECEAITDRDTTVTYTWLLNNQKIEDGSVKTDQSVLFLDLANLPKNGRKYIGEWTCNASNSYSFDVKRASLIDKSAGYIWPYWWIILLILILFLLALFLICLICCCLYRNRGDQYLVDEIEHKNGNDPEKELIASGFHDYQRDRSGSTGTLSSQERTLTKQKRSQGSLGGSQSRLADFAN